jgi:hypothetical protein
VVVDLQHDRAVGLLELDCVGQRPDVQSVVAGFAPGEVLVAEEAVEQRCARRHWCAALDVGEGGVFVFA